MTVAGHGCAGFGIVLGRHSAATCECGYVTLPYLERVRVVDDFTAHVVAVEVVRALAETLTDLDRPTTADGGSDG